MKPIWLAVCTFIGVATLCSTATPDEPDKAAKPGAGSMIGKKPGQARDDNGLKLKLIWCPSGSFTMEIENSVETPEPVAGKDEVDAANELVAKKDDEPNDDDAGNDVAGSPETVTPVKVFLTKGYWLGKYEVTQSEWNQVMRTEPWKGHALIKEGADFPATYVRWADAVDFCRELTKQERQAHRLSDDWEYTLPTEAQWERACRARTETRYWFGNDGSKLGDYAWFIENAWNVGEQYAHQVGEKKPNPWGLHDMYGNAWEWCRDHYAAKPPGGRDPEEKRNEKTRVLRGGSWVVSPSFARSATRLQYWPGERDGSIGFRVALSSVR